MKPTHPPTAAEWMNDPVVLAAMEQAWADSLPGDAGRRHEEGGWIYMDIASGALSVRRAASGAAAELDLTSPPTVAGAIVVGKFHTHPNPRIEGWYTGPSPGDRRVDALHGIQT